MNWQGHLAIARVGVRYRRAAIQRGMPWIDANSRSKEFRPKIDAELVNATANHYHFTLSAFKTKQNRFKGFVERCYLVRHAAEQKKDKLSVSSDKPACETCETCKKEEPEGDDFEKKWEDIEYLIRKPFCCK
jgi:hypothetical protein